MLGYWCGIDVYTPNVAYMRHWRLYTMKIVLRMISEWSLVQEQCRGVGGKPSPTCDSHST